MSGRFHLYHVRPDGKDLVALNDANDPANYLWPSWSPGGGRIAYVTSLGSSSVYRLYLMNSEGKGRRKVLDYAGAIRAPSWSPGGDRMAYQGVDSAANGWDIFVISLDDTTRTNLTRSPGEDQLPSWSPDGSRIAFQSDRHDGTDIYLIDADGSNRVLLVGATTPGIQPRPGHRQETGSPSSPPGTWRRSRKGYTSTSTRSTP